jgi:hypothetical protein
MNSPTVEGARTPAQIDAFVVGFFGPGNTVWPDQDRTSDVGQKMVPYLRFLYSGSEAPAVLPRRAPGDDRLVAYVIAHNRAHANSVRELITAFAGESFSTFDGRPARLKSDDPVERAILDFAGESTTFKVSTSLPPTEGKLWTALQLLQSTVQRRPVRTWRVHKPVGRLLAEFELALATGDSKASAGALEHLEATGGLTGPNLAHLRIKRLARLGRDVELLSMPELADVAATDPPAPVKDAVLTAFYNSVIAEPLEANDLESAKQRLLDRGVLLPRLLAGDYHRLSAESLSVLTLVALVRDDATSLTSVVGHPDSRARLEELSPALAAAAEQAHSAVWPPGLNQTTDQAVEDRTAAQAEQSVAPANWCELIKVVVSGEPSGKEVLRNEVWRDWSPPATQDAEFAEILSGLNDTEAERVWSTVGAFVDADAYLDPAARSAYEFIRNALAYSRFSPADLSGLAALTEIVLRSAPHRREYSSLLNDLNDEIDRWIGPERATVGLDLADLLVRFASPDPEACLRLATALLQPLLGHSRRLESDQVSFARQLSDELKTGLAWPLPSTEEGSGAEHLDPRPLNVLLYSLDEGALDRAAKALQALAPNAKIHKSSDCVGSKQLKQHTRSADVIVMATRCAKHAATGVIRAHASDGSIVQEADGAGSASLLRAAAAGLTLSKRYRDMVDVSA